MSNTFDDELTRMLDEEYAALSANGEPEVEEPPVEVAPPPEIKVPAAWPAHSMFSEVFGGLPKGRRDLPVPQFSAEDWPEEARPMIPSLPNYWVHNLDVQYGIALAVLLGDTSLLVGETGTGKTSGLYAFAAECTIPVWLTPCHERQEPSELIGSSELRADEATGANVTQFNPTQLVNSLDFGGMSIIDEAMRSEVLMTIQGLLEDKHTLVLAEADGLSGAERVKTGEPGKWWLFLTDNTTGTGDESGNYRAAVQDLSTLDRILSTIRVPYNPPAVEVDILGKVSPTTPETIRKDMVAVAQGVRVAFGKEDILQTMSLRALISWVQKYEITGDIGYAFERAFMSKLGAACRGVAAEVYTQVTGNEVN